MAVRAISRSLVADSTVVLEDGSSVIGSHFGGQLTAVWSALANTDTGAPLALSQFSDRSVQISGTFSVGGTIVLEGSNDGTNYHTLTDPAGSAISFTSAGIKTVTEVVKWVRPRVTAGDGSTLLVATLCAIRQL